MITAQAVIIPEGKAMTIQANIKGFVENINAKEGERVAKGRILAVIGSEDVSKSLFDLKNTTAELSEAHKELSQLVPLKVKQLTIQIDLQGDKLKRLTKQVETLGKRMETEQQGFRLKKESCIVSLTKQDEQKKRLNLELANAGLTLALWEKELEAYKTLGKEGLVSEIELLNVQRGKEGASLSISQKKSLFQEVVKEIEIINKNFEVLSTEHINTLRDIQEQIEQVNFDIVSAQSEIIQKKNEIVLMKLEAENKYERASFKNIQSSKLVNLNLRGVNPEMVESIVSNEGPIINRSIIKAPSDGIISQIMIRNEGEIVTLGQTMMTLIPQGVRMVTELRILNKDIGLVKVGQVVKLKFDAFPFMEYGAISGVLTDLMPDAEEDAKLGSCYKAISTLSQEHFRVKGEKISLLSGMTATAEIITDQKTILSLILEPFTKLRKTKDAVK